MITAPDGYRVASRVVFPASGERDVLPNYIDQDANERASGQAGRDFEVVSRTSLRVLPRGHASLGSYFNAFPAAYWRYWTKVRSLRLQVVTSGAGDLTIHRSTARGQNLSLQQIRVEGERTTTEVDLPLNAFGDGGWYWFDLTASASDFVLDEAVWLVPDLGRPQGSATLATTTMNKTDYIVSNMNLLADNPHLTDLLDEILVVDHGSQKVVDADGYAEVAERFDGKLQVIEQPNLGGSGGFARGQYEATKRGRSKYVILMDDDISIEPETIARLITFADLCTTPTLVGGHMFDLNNKSALQTMGEVVDEHNWSWRPARFTQYESHDFAKRGLRESTWLHSRVDVDYNAWWCCLIPTDVIREIGLGLPLFIKWDDVEFGLRAKKAGFPTVSLPGAAVWHMGWVGKDDRAGWQGYFHNRNRLITALMYSPRKRGGDLLPRSLALDLTHLVAMQYHTMASRLMAEEDVLAGPEQLHQLIGTRLGDIRAMADDYDDSTFRPDAHDFPHPPQLRDGGSFRPRIQATTEQGIQRDEDFDEERPVPLKRLATIGLKSLLRQFRPVPPEALERPQATIDSPINKWWQIAQYDSALIVNAEGTAYAWYRRRPEHMRTMTVQAARNAAELMRRWDELAARYQAAIPSLTSFAEWEKTFGIDPADQMAAREEQPATRN